MKLRDITLNGLLDRLASELPNHPALVYPDRSWTFSEFRRDVLRLAGELRAEGVLPGERVAVWATNVPEWFLLQFALSRLGAILVTVNTSLRSHELEYLLRQSGSVMLFTIAGFRQLDYLAEIARMGPLPALRRVVTIGTPLKGQASLEALPDDLDRVVNMQYTSGTTGFPKGVRLTSRNLVNNGFWLGEGLGYTPADRLCLCVPMFHCFGMTIGMLGAWTHGATLYPVEAFDAGVVLETVSRGRCTALYGVPTMFLAELEHPEFESFDLTSLRTGVMAGSLCPEPLMRRVLAHIPEITIVYGLTEASPGVTMTDRFDSLERRTRTVGKALPEVELRIVEGELWVRGSNVMEGYHDDPVATAAAIDRDGWLHTGDEAHLDADGYLRVTGRLKDIIIRGGENISPKEIEDVLRLHPEVADAAVYSIPCSRFGEVPAAAVRRSGTAVDETALQAFCAERLARFKVPQEFRFVDEFPLTASGKVQKFRLRELH
jgi:fatty-acyl-CoA synthase